MVSAKAFCKMLVIAVVISAFSICSNAQDTRLFSAKKDIAFSLTDPSFKTKHTVDTTRLFLPRSFMRNIPLQNNMLPGNHYTANLGFFCKKELIIEKATKVPIRFRLGSLNYCNQLEGKENVK